MNHYLSHIVFCNVQHKEEKIIGYCLNEYCNEESTYCNQCQRTKHQTHPQDCKSMMEVAQLVSDAYGMVLEWQKKAQTELENVKKIYYDIEKYLHIQQMRLIELENFIQNNQHQVTIDYQVILKSYYRLLPQKKDLSSVQLFGNHCEQQEKNQKIYINFINLQMRYKQWVNRTFRKSKYVMTLRHNLISQKKIRVSQIKTIAMMAVLIKIAHKIVIQQDQIIINRMLQVKSQYLEIRIKMKNRVNAMNTKKTIQKENSMNQQNRKTTINFKMVQNFIKQKGLIFRLGNKGENIKAFSHSEQHSSSVTTDRIPLLNFSPGHPLQIPQRVHEEDKINITVTKQELEN